MVEAAEVVDYRERFVSFLKEFQDKNGDFKYRDAASALPLQGKTSLVVDFEDLISYDPDLAKEIKDHPIELFPKLNAAIHDLMRVENMQYASKVKSFKVRFRKLDEVVPLRSLKSAHMGKLIMVEGIITRASAVKQLLKTAVFQCSRCGEKIVLEQTGSILMPPSQCSNQDCGRKGFFRLIPEESSFIDWQMISIQEKPEELPPGQLPRSVEGVLQGDIVDISRPGDRISLVGILQAKQEFTSKGFRLATFSSALEANHLEVAERGTEEVTITPEDEKAIKSIASDPNLYDKLISSIAPSIYDYEEIKEAVAYQLAGGVTKTMPDGIKIRGDINILLVGDPGTAKSQLLQYVSRIAPRGVYTSGKGSTAAGLTATVVRDKNTGEFFLEAGALVIADKGIACIDEIDKMRPEDRSAIHEAMEQQTISIAKAGIVVQLNARSSILAAANPSFGRYVPQKTISENINDLPVTILSRFDLIFTLLDRPEENRDRMMTEHILNLHRGIRAVKESPIPPDLLKKYIYYVRKHGSPKISEEASRAIEDFFLEMRAMGQGADSPVPITMRQLEAVVRLSEARAKLALKEEVSKDDVQVVIRLLKTFLRQVGMDSSTGKIDIDTIMVGRPKSQGDKMSQLFDIFITMER
ncbi:MAG: minichromosome maintenance protein MCM, partial [Candidatus Verstraetearchaeota archaeon]|nr:minichromosome maintenance protein MCM [Candidatus Verstraetearchaeota archaeon]